MWPQWTTSFLRYIRLWLHFRGRNKSAHLLLAQEFINNALLHVTKKQHIIRFRINDHSCLVIKATKILHLCYERLFIFKGDSINFHEMFFYLHVSFYFLKSNVIVEHINSISAKTFLLSKRGDWKSSGKKTFQ